ncbi:hypothetical protein [Streptomyces salyersiae]|uniref:Uncharacterized protein n=1 Tax=Streptomyces salyersiae TaxID=3075530 RepID=A0ABU2RVR1_9ACTN|nr:hypothetical protein [Streptomyces sp. DSM 41770]MDT0432912.1 hypothetical protein [Streptomyces sp. DSM 41770]
MEFDLPIPSPEDGDRAIEIFDRIVEGSEAGYHRLSICLKTDKGGALGGISYTQHHDGADDVLTIDPGAAVFFCHLLAIGISSDARACTFVMRTIPPVGEEIVYGWNVEDGDPKPLNRAEVFDVYCHNPITGELIAPPSGVEYQDAPVIHF